MHHARHIRAHHLARGRRLLTHDCRDQRPSASLVPRSAIASGYYYGVTHYRAYPEHRGASSGLHSYGGRLAGFACGADFTYESEFHGRELRVTGFVQAAYRAVSHVGIQLPAHIEVTDVGGRRHMEGTIGVDFGSNVSVDDRPSEIIDFSLGADGLHGQIASRYFDLAVADADTLARHHVTASPPARGCAELLRAVCAAGVGHATAADQAAILPFMLSCSSVDDGRADVGVNVDSTKPLQVVDFNKRAG